MKRLIGVVKKARGRPRTGAGEFVGMRIKPTLLKKLDFWMGSQGLTSRSEAVRRILVMVLGDEKEK